MMTQARDIPNRLQNPFLTQIKSWETLLLAVAIGISSQIPLPLRIF